ncbi:hypothetical protein R6Q59_034292 [Mikania micrantha]
MNTSKNVSNKRKHSETVITDSKKVTTELRSKSNNDRKSLLRMKDTIPTRFAQWLVSNYDCDRNELNAGHHYIQVTSQTVKDVLGIPIGRLPVNEKNKPTIGSSDTLRLWKSQYPGKSRITVKDVLEQMKKSEEGNWIFKLNWLVVYNTKLGWTTKSTTTYQI